MTRLIWPTCLLATLMPLPALADVELTLGPCVKVQAVQGSEQTAGSGESVTLADGTQQLVVECTAEIGREKVLETSDAFVVRFEAAETALTLSAPEIESRNQMDSFNHQGNWQLTDRQGREVAFTADVLEKEGFQLVRDYARELAAYNRSGSVAAVAVPELKTNQDGLLLDSHVDPDQEMVSRMLRYWYLKADEQTRKEWDSWVDSSNQ
ncbi:DUF2057 domain-containing protein [Marinobacter sp. bablab_jr008]|uniref:YccT family protein n=1 Tax=Marinobacter sp. bablab_jr008 TaxID=2755064 RepID=UPI002B1BD626|nr:DUF2057 domain-containing protein [Marinobacter sp. bablab_jr008]MEC9385713.1 DUF2057 domain-containing protein [Pseudomonadota bacterium]